MTDTEQEIEEYVSHIGLPVTKEELVNGLLARNATGRLVGVVERLPRDTYESRDQLLQDLDSLSRVLASEVASATTFEEFLPIVVRHTGDIRYATKDRFNRVVDHVIHLARTSGGLDEKTADSMRDRLEASFADLRGSMTSVTNDAAPIDPWDDLPAPA